MTCFFLSPWKRATPLTIMLFDSVAPEVKIMSLASAPMRSAMSYESGHEDESRVKLTAHTLRASSTAFSASQPYA
jgi:hypothetical protein